MLISRLHSAADALTSVRVLVDIDAELVGLMPDLLVAAERALIASITPTFGWIVSCGNNSAASRGAMMRLTVGCATVQRITN
ncbi:MAG: hypothetical protein WC205_03100 [Opitutaceae bacterium]|jgi:hypothetical protein